MYAMAKSAREALKSKARRLAGEETGKVDATSVKRPAAFTAEKKVGKAPVNPRAYKKGGAVGKAEGGGNWIKDAIKKPGALHKSLGVPEGEKIPEKKLEKAEHSKNPTTAKRARLAETLKGMREGNKAGGAAKRKGKDLGGALSVLSPAYAVTRALQRGGKDEERDAAEQAKGMAIANAARKSGGRTARKNGGVTVINIGKGASDAPISTPRPAPAPMPMVASPPPMQSQMPVVPPPPAAPIGQQKPPLALKTGGRATKVAKSYKDMTAGAGSGEGRLQKTDIAKRKK